MTAKRKPRLTEAQRQLLGGLKSMVPWLVDSGEAMLPMRHLVAKGLVAAFGQRYQLTQAGQQLAEQLVWHEYRGWIWR